MNIEDHSFGKDCAACGNGRSGTYCAQVKYTPSMREFWKVPAHQEELATVAYAPSKFTSIELKRRWKRELDRMAYGHNGCMCFCRQEKKGYPPCPECKAFRLSDKTVEEAEIARVKRVEPPTPDITALDLAAGHIL